MWEALIPIIARYGLEVGEALWRKWDSDKLPTEEDWAELKAIAGKTPLEELKAALVRANIALDSPEALALIDKLQ